MIVSQGVAKFHLATTPHDQWGGVPIKWKSPMEEFPYIPIINYYYTNS